MSTTGTLEDDVPFLVTEYLPMGSLMSVFKSREGGADFEMGQKLSFCLDAAAGMKYLHSLEPPHIHRDLKPQNMLVTSNWRVKIADFGTAKLLGTTSTATTTNENRQQLTERYDFNSYISVSVAIEA